MQTEKDIGNQSDVKNELIGHLDEMRKRIIKILVFFILTAILAFVFVEQIMDFLLTPVDDFVDNLYTFSFQELLMSYFEIAFLCGIVLSAPFILYQITMFVLPALHKHEKKYYFTALFFVALLFGLGVFFSYNIVAPVSFKFFYRLSVSNSGVQILPGLKTYLNLLFSLVIMSGIVFQTPIVVILLTKLGIVNHKFLAKYRGYIVVLVLILAAILTPPDIFSQLAFAIPMYLLFEISILASRIIKRREEKKQNVIPFPED